MKDISCKLLVIGAECDRLIDVERLEDVCAHWLRGAKLYHEPRSLAGARALVKVTDRAWHG